MKVPLLDLKAQYAPLREEIRAAMDRVCDSQVFILGPEVASFEEQVAPHCGARHAIGVSSGTDALLAALMAAGVKAGDEVITTPYSFFATTGAIARLCAVPVFVDIDPANFNINTAGIAAKVTGKTKVILPVSLFGQCVELDDIMAIANAHGLCVIEDAAQSIGARDRRGRLSGCLAHMACFSFFPSKNLGAFGDAGLVVSNDDTLAEALRIIRAHGSKPKYYHRIVGGNFRLDALQAAILKVKLGHLAGWTESRRRNAASYREFFVDAGLAGRIAIPADQPGHIYNQFVIRIPQRDALQAFLNGQGIGTEVYYPLPLHLQECFNYLGHRVGDFPHAEAAARESLALPVYPEMDRARIAYVVEQIAAFLRGM